MSPENIQSLERVIETPMSNEDIWKYLPDANIVSYNKLPEYGDIEKLLPNNKSYCVLLYQDSENSGHWCALSRYNDVVEFFDSYGNAPDKQLSWVPKEQRQKIGIDANYLSRMLKATKLPCIYNTVKYQAESPDVATCGRHVCWRLLNLLNKDMTLKDYTKFMKSTGLPADILVSERIDRTSE